ncbi:MAG: VWA domain-containing protein [Acidobacteria bacterium]|nr:VWA domain-containing protein [Acidobacteriota bacterium]
MIRLRAFAAAALAIGATMALPRAQAGPAQVFTGAVDLVDVEVSVLDRHRLPVRDLTTADFTVLEEGQPRPIVAFTPVDLPRRVLPPAAWMDDVAPDVHTNVFPREGRLVVILLDAFIDAADAVEGRRIAEAAVQQLRHGDMAAIAWTMPGVPQNFTADRQRLLDVIRQPVFNVPGGERTGTGFCPCGNGACAMEAIASAAEGIQDVGWRRKILLFVGRRLPLRGQGGCGSMIDAARRRALRASEAGNLTIHVIDPRGLDTLAPPASARGIVSRPPPGMDARRISGLLAVTSPTGGRLVTRNDPSAVLPEVFRESDAYYVLGFPPAAVKPDGRFRRITVKVNRKDVTLQARRGYYAGGHPLPKPARLAEGLPPALVASVTGLWPKTDLQMALSAVPVARPGLRGGVVAVLVRVRRDRVAAESGIAVAPDAGSGANAVLLTTALDSNGNTLGLDRRDATVTPRRTGDGLVEYELASRLELKPGRYEIRAAVEDAATGRTGSAYTYVDVPDFGRQLVSLSGMFVQAGGDAGAIAGAPLVDLTPLVPTTRREFSRTERVRAFVHEYQSAARTFMPGYATTEIRDDTDTRVYHREERIVPAGPQHQAMDFAVDVPVSSLRPGAHVLTFTVRHGNETARREVRFVVE